MTDNTFGPFKDPSETENHQQAGPPAKAKPLSSRPAEPDISSPPSLSALRASIAISSEMYTEGVWATWFKALTRHQMSLCERLGEDYEKLSPRTPVGVEGSIRLMAGFLDALEQRQARIARLHPNW